VQYVPPHRGGGLGGLGKDVEVALNAACPVRAAHVPLAKVRHELMQMQSDCACLGRRCWQWLQQGRCTRFAGGNRTLVVCGWETATREATSQSTLFGCPARKYSALFLRISS